MATFRINVKKDSFSHEADPGTLPNLKWNFLQQLVTAKFTTDGP